MASSLPAQQQRLLAGLPGVRHLRGGGLVVARQRVETQVDAGRQHQPVVGERRAVGEPDRARLRIHFAAACATTVTPSAAILS